MAEVEVYNSKFTAEEFENAMRNAEDSNNQSYETGYTEGYSQGNEEGYAKGYADGGFMWQRVRHFTSIFELADFPKDTEIVLDISNDNGIKKSHIMYYDLNSAFASSKGIKSIKIVAKEKYPMSLGYAFRSINELELIDLSDNPLIRGIGYTFEYTDVKTILGELDVSACSSFNNSFNSTGKLETIRFKKGVIRANISFDSSSKLTDESIQSIIDGLADLTGQTMQTLDFHSDIVDKLTDEQYSQIMSKNWSVT